MIIAFDTWSTNRRFRNSGIHSYTLKLLQEFKEIGNEKGLQVCGFVGKKGNHDVETILPGGAFSLIQTPALDEYLVWRIWGLARTARTIASDVIFVPHTQVIPSISSVPVVVTIHDTTPVRTSWQMDRKLTLAARTFLWFAANYSTRIVTPSEASKRDVVELYGIDPDKIRVTYLGYNRLVYNPNRPEVDLLTRLKEKFGIFRPYLFHHGTVQPRKNLAGLIRAHRLLLDRDDDLQLDLVLAGPLGWLYEPVVRLAGQTSSQRGRVIFTKSLDDGELAVLLKGADVCVFPSFYEGFCLPMVEAMACGIPTVASTSSCLPEVSGDVLRYFDPNDIDEMAEVISTSLHDSSERKRLSEAGIKQSAKFTWRQTAEQTIEVLADVCRKRAK